MKELRRDAYEKAQERNKAYWNGIKKASKEKSARKRIVKHDKLLRNMVLPASTIKVQGPPDLFKSRGEGKEE
jgi:ribosome modulation factor